MFTPKEQTFHENKHARKETTPTITQKKAKATTSETKTTNATKTAAGINPINAQILFAQKTRVERLRREKCVDHEHFLDQIKQYREMLLKEIDYLKQEKHLLLREGRIKKLFSTGNMTAREFDAHINRKNTIDSQFRRQKRRRKKPMRKQVKKHLINMTKSSP